MCTDINKNPMPEDVTHLIAPLQSKRHKETRENAKARKVFIPGPKR